MILTSIDVIKQTLMVSGFVLFMLLLIEYINVSSKGMLHKRISQSWFKQILLSISLGIVPGCMGTFMVVSLYTHHFIGFSALIAGTIASFGDEAFILFSTSPLFATYLSIILGGIALIAALAYKLIFKEVTKTEQPLHFETHEENCSCTKPTSIKLSLQKISPFRALLIAVLLLLILSQFLGFNHNHDCSDHAISHMPHSHSPLSTESIVFMIMGALTVIVFLTVPEHFLIEHFWNHVIKKHFIPILLWTFGTILTITIMLNFFDISNWINNNTLIVISLAILIGIIPVSGPHLIFISLFLHGIIPFSVLIINSVMQEGHGALPLLAESKKSFIKLKLIKIIIAIIIAVISLIFNF